MGGEVGICRRRYQALGGETRRKFVYFGVEVQPKDEVCDLRWKGRERMVEHFSKIKLLHSKRDWADGITVVVGEGEVRC